MSSICGFLWLLWFSWHTQLLRFWWPGAAVTRRFFCCHQKKSTWKRKTTKTKFCGFSNWNWRSRSLSTTGARHHSSAQPLHLRNSICALEFEPWPVLFLSRFNELRSMHSDWISNSLSRNKQSKNAAAKKRSFLHTLILGNQKQASQKNYRTLIFLVMLGHMQKVSHFWTQMKKTPKMSVRTFLPWALQ